MENASLVKTTLIVARYQWQVENIDKLSESFTSD